MGTVLNAIALLVDAPSQPPLLLNHFHLLLPPRLAPPANSPATLVILAPLFAELNAEYLSARSVLESRPLPSLPPSLSLPEIAVAQTNIAKMNCFLVFISVLIAISSTLTAASNTFMDYQNYNHGYCPDCNCYPCKCAGGTPPQADPVNPQEACPKPDPCCPPATTACTQCGLNIVYIGLGIAVIATAATLVIGSGNGSVHGHLAP